MYINSNIVISGEHSRMMKELQKVSDITSTTPTYIDIYLTAGAIGAVLNTKSSEQKNDEYEEITITKLVLMPRRNLIEFLFQVCALNEYFDEDDEKAVNIAFEVPSNTDTKPTKKQILFHEYALGGIEILYKHIIQNETNIAPIEATNDLLDMIINKEQDEQPFDTNEFLKSIS